MAQHAVILVKTSQKTRPRLKVSSVRLLEPGIELRNASDFSPSPRQLQILNDIFWQFLKIGTCFYIKLYIKKI